MNHLARWRFLWLLAATACAGNDSGTGADPIVPGGIDGGSVEAPDGGRAPDETVDAGVPAGGDGGGGQTDPGGDGLPPDPGKRFLTSPPAAACSAEVAANFTPKMGFSGGIPGTKTCGPTSPDCPTKYIPGNSGAACDSAADCTGPDPVCFKGDKYMGGTCAATGCELGSNFGCPQGGMCINGGDGQTYCLASCGIDESGCFVGCSREGMSCFSTESKSMGLCLSAAGVRQCNPKASATCKMDSFGDGICVQTSWDDQTVGRCFETCDPVVQDCSVDGQGCYVLREYSGYPVCFQSWGYPEGTECDRMTECAEGLRCACDRYESPCTTGLICRRYCALDGSTACASGTTCKPLAPRSRWGSCLPP